MNTARIIMRSILRWNILLLCLSIELTEALLYRTSFIDCAFGHLGRNYSTNSC